MPVLQRAERPPATRSSACAPGVDAPTLAGVGGRRPSRAQESSAGRADPSTRWAVARAGAVRVLGLVVIVLASVACGGEQRPSVEGWTPRWEAILAVAPASGEDLDRAVCERLLVAAREAEPDLLPTPDEALDGPVQRWLDEAETIGFECENYGDAEHGRAELEILEAEVDAGLAALGER